MGLLNTSLQIGRSALLAQSLAIDVVGNNIANAATDGFARQVVDLRPQRGIRTSEGVYLGLGVNADAIRRISDFYLEQRLRDARSNTEGLRVQDETFQRLEGIFNELTDTDLSSMMNEFFTSLNTLQLNPEDRSVRRAVAECAQTFVSTVRMLREKMNELRSNIDAEMTGAVNTVNSLTKQIAAINSEITRVESGGANAGSATALRDRRDVLLAQLADVLEVRVVEQQNGHVSVFAGSDPLVMGVHAYDLATETRLDRGVEVTDVVFAEDNRPLTAKGGKIAGLIAVRDTGVPEFIDRLDTWAGAFIDGFNRIHSSGQGLDMYQEITGAKGVSDPASVLNAAGLDFTPQTGTFDIKVRNSTSGEIKTFRFHVDLDGINGDDTTLTSLIADINGQLGATFPDITASLGAGNTLRINSAAPELSFAFSNDTSGALACLGVNTFFIGKDCTDMALNPLLDANPGLIAAAQTNMPGDNSNVTQLLAFQKEPWDSLGGSSVDDYYQGLVSTLGIRTAAVRDRNLGAQALQAAIQGQRETLSGVSLDEETVKLIRYQSGYRAAARFISTVDEMIKTLLEL